MKSSSSLAPGYWLLGLGLLAASPLAAPAQTILTNNGGTLVVRPGGLLHVNGSLTQTGPALLRTSGTATVSGNVTSAAASTLDLSTGLLDLTGNATNAGTTTGTTGTLRLSGPAAQTLALNLGTVPNLTVDKPTGAATLTQPVQVREVLTMANTGNLNLNGQALTLLSDASGTALVVNSGTGVVSGSTATMQRHLTTANLGRGYRQYSSPVSGNTMTDLATVGFTPVFNTSYNNSATSANVTPFPTVFGYDQGRIATALSSYTGFDKGWFSPAAGDSFVAGVGYTVNLPGTEMEAFTGTLHTGPYARTLARGTDPLAGYHLVGNPYPAPLDWSQVLATDRNGLDGAMYVFESSSQYGGTYRAYTNGIGQNPLIGSSQGFFVHVTNANSSGSLTFRNSQRKVLYSDQVPVKRGAADTRPLVQLALAGNGLHDDLFVYAQAGATAGVDANHDAAKLPNPTGLNLASLAATGQALAIDGRPAFAATTSIPLQVSVPATGSYTLTAAALANLAGTRVELADNLTGTRTALVAGTAYRFAMSATTAPGRFWLNLTAAGALASATQAISLSVTLYPNPAHGSLTVLRPAGATVTAARLLNSLGQTVRTLALPTAQTVLDLRGLATGVYTLRLTLDGQPVSKRVVVE